MLFFPYYTPMLVALMLHHTNLMLRVSSPHEKLVRTLTFGSIACDINIVIYVNISQGRKTK